MTLAALLSISMFFSASAVTALPSSSIQSAGQQVPAATPADSSAPQQQNNPPAAESSAPPAATGQAPSTPSQSTPGQNKPTPAKHRRHKKKTASNCTPSATGTSPTSTDPASSGATASSAPPANCPPPKTVVRDGGTSEPSIQLIGGEGGAQASGKRSSTDQLLGSTAENLKKLEGRKLNSSQQEMLNQIHQYVEQAKAAVTAGDVERGHNLATKAHLLSDELAKP